MIKLTSKEIKLIEDNWEAIKKCAAELWNTQFKTSFNARRMNKDDYDSLIGEIVCKAAQKYDDSKASFVTYCVVCIKGKVITFLVDSSRQKRKDFYKTENIDDVDVKSEADIKAMGLGKEITPEIQKFLDKISKQELALAFLKYLGYDYNEIAKKFSIEKTELYKIIRALKRHAKQSKVI